MLKIGVFEAEEVIVALIVTLLIVYSPSGSTKSKIRPYWTVLELKVVINLWELQLVFLAYVCIVAILPEFGRVRRKTTYN